MAVVTALLHDVLDDTEITEQQLEEEFGNEITDMVKKVSRLSALNQLLRRKRRQQHESGAQVDDTSPPLGAGTSTVSGAKLDIIHPSLNIRLPSLFPGAEGTDWQSSTW